jgi:outer membrane protein assembly factor BamB
MDSKSSPDASSPPPKGLVPKGRWLPSLPVKVLLALPLLAAAYFTLFDPLGDRGSANVFTFGLLVLFALIYLVWYMFWSGHPWRLRFLPPLGLALALVAFFQVFRLERVSGDMVPTFVLRSTEVADRRLSVPANPRRGTVDLATVTPDDFPEFLGPEGRMAVEHLELLRDWKAQPPEEVWRQPIGAGWSAFAVRNGYAVTMEQRGDEELVTCYEVASGELRWSHSIAARYQTAVAVAGAGPRSTPAINEGWVYAHGATGDLVAIDGATGELMWEQNIPGLYNLGAEQEAVELPYGRSGSPLVVGDLVIVPAGGFDGSYVSLVAFHKKTGEKVWEAGDRQISCASPTYAADLGGVPQVLSVNEDNVSGHNPLTGKVLWHTPWPGRTENDASVSQPVPLPGNRVFLSKGYGVGGALIELESAGDGTFTASTLWESKRVMRSKFTNVTIYQGYVYGLSDGILECIELETGKRAWKKGRYKQGQVLRVGGTLLVIAESGEVVMVEASPDSGGDELGRFQAIEGKTWNNPALFGSYLLVRNAEEAACFRLPLES